MRDLMTRGLAAAVLALATAGPSLGAQPDFTFDSIDGGTIALSDWRGAPVLVVNTASLCGFAGQYDELQTLQDRYAGRGLRVLAVPSDDFAQELDSAAEVKSYCEANFDLTLPMTDITPVLGQGAHPFYRWLAATDGFVPRWNFNKVLLAPDGSVDGTWGATTAPLSAAMTDRIEALLP